MFDVFKNLGASEFLASSTLLKTNNDREWSKGTELGPVVYYLKIAMENNKVFFKKIIVTNS